VKSRQMRDRHTGGDPGFTKLNKENGLTPVKWEEIARGRRGRQRSEVRIQESAGRKQETGKKRQE